MPIGSSPVQTVAGLGPNPAFSLTATGAGHSLILVGYDAGQTAITAITPGSWTIYSVAGFNGAGMAFLAYCIGAPPGTTTVSATGGSAAWDGAIVEWAGIGSFDAYLTNATSYQSQTIEAGASGITPAKTNELFIASCSGSSVITAGPSIGSEIPFAGGGIGQFGDGAYYLAADSAAHNITWTQTLATGVCCILATFQATSTTVAPAALIVSKQTSRRASQW